MHSAQAVVMGERVYVGGGLTEKPDNKFHVFQYNTTRDEWSPLPPHTVCYFAMAQFTGKLITVGGGIPGSGPTGKVYRFKEEFQEWEEFITPMPTARPSLTVATTQSTIIASGGATSVKDGKVVPCATVEVYCSETSQWYTADPLPVSCFFTPSVALANTYYLLGGNDADALAVTTILYASLTSLIQKATSPNRQSASCTPVWKILPDTPLNASAVASLCGNLLAVGGHDSGITTSAVHAFFPFTNSWVRVTDGDLPEPRYMCTAVQLSSNTMMVIGGSDDHSKHTKSVFTGTITV